MIDIFITTLAEMISTQHDVDAGIADCRSLREAKKRLSQALYEIIDHRIDAAFDARRKVHSQDRIATADTINTGVKSMASAVKSLAALNSAPPPPQNITDIEAIEKWRKNYQEWYENTRKAGLTIG